MIGATPIGTRTIGDSTGSITPPPKSSAVLYNGTSTFTPLPGDKGVVGFLSLRSRARVIFRKTIPYISNPNLGQVEPYKVVVTNTSGVRYGELENVRIGTITWTLNGVGSCDFTVPVMDAKALLPKVPTREVQIWRGNHLLWWGPVVRKMSDKDTVTFNAQSLEWYWTKRVIGKANRTNQVLNPSFDQGVYGWTISSGDPVAPVANIHPRDVSISKDILHTGSRAVKITMAQDKPACQLLQAFFFTPPADRPKGNQWTVVAWFYIADWQGPAWRNMGLQIGRYSATETVTIFSPELGREQIYPKTIQFAQVPFDTDTTRNSWVRAEVPITQSKPGVQEIVQIGLSAIQGTIYWDTVALTQQESLWFNATTEMPLIAKGVVEHLQDPAYGKSSLNIGTNCQLTGVKREREYLFQDHQRGDDVLGEFPTLNNGFDASIEITPTTRTYTTWFPYKGYRQNSIILEYGRNIIDYTVAEDGENTANSVIVLGDGDGSDREEGGAIDAAALDGLILEKVYNSTPGAPIQTLNDQATRGVTRFKNTVIIPTITTIENAGELIGSLAVGDVCRVKISHGAITVDDLYRVIAISLDPNTDQMSLTVNPLTEEVLQA